MFIFASFLFFGFIFYLSSVLYFVAPGLGRTPEILNGENNISKRKRWWMHFTSSDTKFYTRSTYFCGLSAVDISVGIHHFRIRSGASRSTLSMSSDIRGQVGISHEDSWVHTTNVQQAAGAPSRANGFLSRENTTEHFPTSRKNEVDVLTTE